MDPVGTIVQGAALGAFLGALLAVLTRREDRVSWWAANGSALGGVIGACRALAEVLS